MNAGQLQDVVLAPNGESMLNAFCREGNTELSAETLALIQRRERLLGPAYRLFYQKPLNLCRGSGVHVYDDAGVEYLDAYNNVVSIGHGHPAVVGAVARQMERLCTHTRYLDADILDYAEKLLALLGGRMAASGHLMFTCTGSEANDLALRLARHVTGREGVIVTTKAYHGTSFLTSAVSPALGGASTLGEWIRRIQPPDSFREQPHTLIERFLGEVKSQIAELEKAGHGLSAFLVDPMFTSDGVFSHPTELLAPVVKLVHDAGGLVIMDEVQTGFARTGEAFWGYQRHGIEPDIVTMGKPMGNGYPIAGLAVLPEVTREFGKHVRYFNTFGGNNVAIAAARATLDVICSEALQEKALHTGERLRNTIRGLAGRFDCIADIRGAGLYIGVELAKRDAGRTPDAELANAVVNGMRERGVLISATGINGNCLKIRPPLVFTDNHIDRFATVLEKTLAACCEADSHSRR